MRNKRLIIAVLAAVAFGLIAAVSVSRYLANAQEYTRNLSNVVVARTDIEIGSRIIPEQLTVVQFPRSVAPEGTYAKIDDRLVGRIAVTKISAREPITEGRLAPEGSAAGLSAIIPEGYRAMNVRVDDVVGISGFIMPGTLVDIVVVIDPPQNQNRERISKIVLQNIKVLANGANLDRPKNEKEAERVRTVTLQVTPEQAEKLALASSEGRLQLVMRNSIDQGDEVTTGASKADLLRGERATPVPDAGIGKKETTTTPRTTTVRRVRPRPVETTVSNPKPAPPPVERPSIEVIEGAKKRNVDFP
ncbi:MAG TPA: Flp pilus assembly protein CpaB [Pyrinomonadaceae bacterium]|nr:Flp pilus assembly protein CpaB [Pyrinomonadaceae bacterium]